MDKAATILSPFEEHKNFCDCFHPKNPIALRRAKTCVFNFQIINKIASVRSILIGQSGKIKQRIFHFRLW